MPRTRNPAPAEFREQLVALVRTGRSVESLAREYQPCAATIHEWVRQEAADDGDVLNRLTHHVNILEMNGESYRLNQSRARISATNS